MSETTVTTDGESSGHRPARADGGGVPITADLVAYNGNIVSLDDEGINDNAGTTAETLVVRDGEIVDLLDDGAYEAWVGDDTELIDLEGRTVIPGIIDCHSHLHEHTTRMFGPVVAPDLFEKHLTIIRGEYDTAEALLEDILEIIERKTEELDEGEWIIVMPYRALYYPSLPEPYLEETDLSRDNFEEADFDKDLQGLATGIFERDLFSKEELDELTPDHPVMLANHPFYIPNERAFEWYEEEYGERPVGDETVDLFRCLVFDVLLDGDPDLISEAISHGQDVYLTNGITTYGTHVYPMSPLDAYFEMDRRGEVKPRLAWGTTNLHILNPESSKYHKRAQQMHGHGSDLMWNAGVSLVALDAGPPSICTTLDGPDEVKARESCDRVTEGSVRNEALKTIAARGARFACSNHALGDKAVDRGIDAIIEGSKEAGLTDEEIRERQHAFDHGGLYPRPDQVERCKEYNIRLNLNVWESWRIKHLSGMLEPYPEEAKEQAEQSFAGAKNALDQGLKVGMHGRELENPFPYIAALVTRRWEGDPVGLDLAIDRVKALKMATTWNAEYLLREDLGSLEVGNKADFIALDRDYFSVPEDELKEIESELTVVDGDVEYQSPAF